jgi:hypothetical protein
MTLTAARTSTAATTFKDDTGFTVKLPPGWTVLDYINTGLEGGGVEESDDFISSLGSSILSICPPDQGVITEEQDTIAEEMECPPGQGQILVKWYLNIDTNEYFIPYINEVDPETGAFNLNITADSLIQVSQELLPSIELVETKDMFVNITDTSNGTQWQVPGKLALFSTPNNTIHHIGLYFLDNTNTTGYEVTYLGPRGNEDPILGPDPRGEPIPVSGIGLDNLPQIFNDPIQIFNSVSIQRPPPPPPATQWCCCCC